MERLRAAIEQARKTRSSDEAAALARSGPATESTANDQPAEATANGAAAKVQQLNGDAPATPQPDATGPVRMPAELAAKWNALERIPTKPWRWRRNRLVADTKGQDRSAFDMLRTRLLTVTAKEGWRRIAVTSPTMSCGKSTVTLNLAFSLSRLPDVRTLVIEADMRRPSMARMLGAKGKDSFFDVLHGQADASTQFKRLADNVAISLNYAVARNPAELLHGRRTAAILEMIEETYQPDIVLFDMPPMLQSDDTLGFIKNVDCAMLVALSETTTLDQVDFCETELANHTNIAGVVLNRCRYSGGNYGYGYGYGEY